MGKLVRPKTGAVDQQRMEESWMPLLKETQRYHWDGTSGDDRDSKLKTYSEPLKKLLMEVKTGFPRHNSLRDFCARFHQRLTGHAAVTEQRVPAWDRIHPSTGLLEQARLDVATRDAVHGRPIFVDTTVTCAHSGYLPCQRARAGRDGLAASNAVDKKRERYPPAGGELVPVAFEAGGRPADTTVAFVRG